MENTVIKGTAWSGAEKKKLREIMSDKSRSRDENLKIAVKDLNRTSNACSWQWYMTTSKGKRLYAKKRGKRATAIVEKLKNTPAKETKKLPIITILRDGELVKGTCIGGTNGTTIYKADNLIILINTN